MARYGTDRKPVVVSFILVLGESSRCPWKTTGEFSHGRSTLEWAVIQAAYTKYVTTVVVVSEPNATKIRELLGRLPPGPAQDKLIHWERPEELMHPVADTGGEPHLWAIDHWYTLHHVYGSGQYPRPNIITSTFCVDPLKPPGVYDRVVQTLLDIGNPDGGKPQAATVCAKPLCEPIEVDVRDGYATRATITRVGPARLVTAYLTAWTWMGWDNRKTGRSAIIDVPDWMLRHIDTPEDWEVAKLLFDGMILKGNPHIYEEYWKGVNLPEVLG